MAGSASLIITATAQDKATKVLKSTRATLRKLEKQLDDASGASSKFGRAVGKAVGQNTKLARSATKTADKIGVMAGKLSLAKAGMAAMGGMAVIGGIKALVSWGKAGAQAAAQTEVLRKKVEGFDVLMAQAGASTRGVVAAADIRQAIATMDAFEIPLSMTSGLLEQASKAAIRMGRSTSAMVESLSMGIGKLSPQRLDELGIVLKIGDVRERAALALGLEADAVSDLQVRSQLATESLKQLAAANKDVSLSAGDLADYAKAEVLLADGWERFKESIAAPVVAVWMAEIGQVMGHMVDLKDLLDGTTEAAEASVATFSSTFAGLAAEIARSGGATSEELYALKAAFDDLHPGDVASAQQALKNTLDQMPASVAALVGQVMGLSRAQVEAADSADLLTAAMAAAQYQQAGYYEDLAGMDEAIALSLKGKKKKPGRRRRAKPADRGMELYETTRDLESEIALLLESDALKSLELELVQQVQVVYDDLFKTKMTIQDFDIYGLEISKLQIEFDQERVKLLDEMNRKKDEGLKKDTGDKWIKDNEQLVQFGSALTSTMNQVAAAEPQLAMVGSAVGDLSAVWTEYGKAGTGSNEDLGKALIKTGAGIGSFVAGQIKDTRTRAAVEGAFMAAQAVGLAFFDPPAAIAAGIGAAMMFALAGTSGSGKKAPKEGAGKGAGGAAGGSAGVSSGSTKTKTRAIIVNFHSGIMLGDKQSINAGIQQATSSADGTGQEGPRGSSF